MIKPSYIGISKDIDYLYVSDEKLDDTIVVSIPEILKQMADVIQEYEN